MSNIFEVLLSDLKNNQSDQLNLIDNFPRTIPFSLLINIFLSPLTFYILTSLISSIVLFCNKSWFKKEKNKICQTDESFIYSVICMEFSGNIYGHFHHLNSEFE